MVVKEKGKLFIKGEVKSGMSKAGNPWANQQIVVEVYGFGNSLKRVAIRTNKTEFLEKIEKAKVGAECEFEYAVSAREWEGKWFNDVELVSFALVTYEDRKPAPKAEPRQVSPLAYTREETDPKAHTEDLPF